MPARRRIESGGSSLKRRPSTGLWDVERLLVSRNSTTGGGAGIRIGRSEVGLDGGTALLASQLGQGVQLGIVGTREPASVVTKLQACVEGGQDLVIRARQFYPEIPGEPECDIRPAP